MPISAAQVMNLREKTGVSMMACKRALEESGGDETKAIDILRKRGEAKSAEKASRSTGEGVLAIAVSENKACMSVLRCETDFVARNPDFIKLAQERVDRYLKSGQAAQAENETAIKSAVNTLGENIQMGVFQATEAAVIGSYVHSNRKIGVVIGLDQGSAEQARDVAMHAAAMNPMVKYSEEIPPEVIAKEREIWTEQLKQEGKPSQIMEQILKGKEKKFREENALASQIFVKDNTMTVGKYLGKSKIVQYVRMVV